MTAALTREQKLMAEQVVQLGNIADCLLYTSDAADE